MIEKLKNIVSEQLGTDPRAIGVKDSFEGDMNADSLDMIELTMAIEDAFGVDIPDEDAEKLTNVELIAGYLAAKGIE